MNRPLSLIIVVGLFILVGAAGAWQTIAQTSPNHIFINPLLLCIFIGIGLFRRRQLWRYIALACVWVLIVALVASTAVIYAFPNGDYNFMAAWSALPVKISSTTLGLIIMLSVLIWMRWVLARKDVYELFTNRDA